MYYYALSSSDNLQMAFSYAESWILQPFFAAAISVDSFYTISGLLLAYGFFEKQKRRPSKNLTIDVLRGIVYRYIRVAPCFMIVRHFCVLISFFLFTQNSLVDAFCRNDVNLPQRQVAVSGR